MRMTNENSSATLRPMSCELGNLSRPDGSSTFFQGDTCILSAVYGPCEVRMNKELLDRATVDIVYKPKSGLPSCSDKATEKYIRSTCETALLSTLHPRSSLNITVQEVQDSGSFLAVGINSCCLALLDASVSMKCTVAAVNCCISSDEAIILDPTKKQEEESSSVLTFVFESRDKNIVTVAARGKYSREQFQKCLVTCREASAMVFDFYRDTVERKLSKTV